MEAIRKKFDRWLENEHKSTSCGEGDVWDEEGNRKKREV